MDYDTLIKLEKYFQEKYKEPVFQVPEQSKNSRFIIDLSTKIQNIEEKKNEYSIIKPKRNTSVFEQKCKHCDKFVYKKLDLSTYYKSNYCYDCYIRYEEL